MDVRNLKGRTVLVTGAASGIGKETALAFGRRGADLVICDVDESGLKTTEAALRALGRQVLARRVDVSDREAMRAFAEETHAQVGALDILMNNAGVGLGAGFLDTTLEDWDWIVRINLLGVVHGCHFFVPPMAARGAGGHVVNVSSAAGYLPAQALCAYVATKYAVLGLSEALRIELREHGIGVTAICPGIIDTPITRTARLRGRYAAEGQREQMIEAYRKRGYGPERVAENVLRAIQRDRAIAPVSPEAWIGWYLKRLSPALASRLMAWAERRSRGR
ncbi:MAG TPA: SDR family NAD(P)-dependent oxidoreductase [Myxococcota bacterium]